MRLDRLIGDLDVIELRGDAAATEISSVTHDSRAVVPGALFCCVPGDHVDGHDFAAGAVRDGATALLVERLLPLEAVQVRVASTRRSMGPAAAAFWDHPSRAIPVLRKAPPDAPK